MKIDPRMGMSRPVDDGPSDSQVSRVTNIVVGTILGFFLLATFLSHSSGFRASKPWLYVSLAAALSIVVVVCRLILRAPPPFGLRDNKGWGSHAAMYLVVTFLVGGLAWNAIGTTLPALVTRIWGVQSAGEFDYIKRKTSAKQCSNRLLLHIDAGDPAVYCADFRSFESLPDRGIVRVTLRTTWFGAHVANAEPVEN